MIQVSLTALICGLSGAVVADDVKNYSLKTLEGSCKGLEPGAAVHRLIHGVRPASMWFPLTALAETAGSSVATRKRCAARSG
jgi:hypothetical protein